MLQLIISYILNGEVCDKSSFFVSDGFGCFFPFLPETVKFFFFKLKSLSDPYPQMTDQP